MDRRGREFLTGGRGSTDVEVRMMSHGIRVLELQIGQHAISLPPFNKTWRLMRKEIT